VTLHAPQIVLIVLIFVSLILSAHDHGKPRKPDNFWISLVSAALMLLLLWWGRFFR
jgi:hypothetical protein